MPSFITPGSSAVIGNSVLAMVPFGVCCHLLHSHTCARYPQHCTRYLITSDIAFLIVTPTMMTGALLAHPSFSSLIFWMRVESLQVKSSRCLCTVCAATGNVFWCELHCSSLKCRGLYVDIRNTGWMTIPPFASRWAVFESHHHFWLLFLLSHGCISANDSFSFFSFS